MIQKLQEEVAKAREEADRLKAAAAEGKEDGDDDEGNNCDGEDGGAEGGDDDVEGVRGRAFAYKGLVSMILWIACVLHPCNLSFISALSMLIRR